MWLFASETLKMSIKKNIKQREGFALFTGHFSQCKNFNLSETFIKKNICI